MIIFYHDDLDGQASASIAYRVFKPTETACGRVVCHAVNYHRDFPLGLIETGEKVVLLDFCPKPGVLAQILSIAVTGVADGAQSAVTWIDHHPESIDAYRDLVWFAEAVAKRQIEGVRQAEVGVAACALTWRWYHRSGPLPEAVELVSDWDIGERPLHPDTVNFKLGLEVQPTEPESDTWRKLLGLNVHPEAAGSKEDSDRRTRSIISDGQVIGEWRERFFERYRRAYGFRCVLDMDPDPDLLRPYRSGEWSPLQYRRFPCRVVNLSLCGSDATGTPVEGELLSTFVWDGGRWSVSLYSAGDIDCKEIAAELGLRTPGCRGGGHRNAAGFTCDELPFTEIQPWEKPHA